MPASITRAVSAEEESKEYQVQLRRHIDAVQRHADVAAFDEIYQLTIKEMKLWIAYRCHRWDMIEECLQATYVTAYKALPKFTNDRPFLPWLKGIAKNEIGKYLQRQKRRSQGGEKTLIEAQLLCEENEDNAEAESEDELEPRLTRCLNRLSEGMRNLVWQRYVEERSVQGMAENVGRTANAVSVSLHRAREALRRCIQGEH